MGVINCHHSVTIMGCLWEASRWSGWQPVLPMRKQSAKFGLSRLLIEGRCFARKKRVLYYYQGQQKDMHLHRSFSCKSFYVRQIIRIYCKAYNFTAHITDVQNLVNRGYHSGWFDVRFDKRFQFWFEWIFQNASGGVLEFRIDFDSLLPSMAHVADFQISLKGVIITNGMTFHFL